MVLVGFEKDGEFIMNKSQTKSLRKRVDVNVAVLGTIYIIHELKMMSKFI